MSRIWKLKSRMALILGFNVAIFVRNRTTVMMLLPYYHDTTYFWEYSLFTKKERYLKYCFPFETSLFAWLSRLQIPA